MVAIYFRQRFDLKIPVAAIDIIRRTGVVHQEMLGFRPSASVVGCSEKSGVWVAVAIGLLTNLAVAWE